MPPPFSSSTISTRAGDSRTAISPPPCRLPCHINTACSKASRWAWRRPTRWHWSRCVRAATARQHTHTHTPTHTHTSHNSIDYGHYGRHGRRERSDTPGRPPRAMRDTGGE
eukprot:15044205-Heterocapsa_arctica.AAC.1